MCENFTNLPTGLAQNDLAQAIPGKVLKKCNRQQFSCHKSMSGAAGGTTVLIVA